MTFFEVVIVILLYRIAEVIIHWVIKWFVGSDKITTNFDSQTYLKNKSKGNLTMEIQQDQRGFKIYRFKTDDGVLADPFSFEAISTDDTKMTVAVEHPEAGVYKVIMNWVALGAAIMSMTALRFDGDDNPHHQETGVTLIPDVTETFETEEGVEEL